MSLLGRLGLFILFISLIVLVVFFATDAVGNTTWTLFCFGALFFILGLAFYIRGRPKPKPSGRFRLLRGSRKNEEEE